ncbi:MAG TPA: protein-methionine-sulfoxide reductase catalytic subunit MsrP [Terriglobales bacterium]|nr:protein-methionine-sulfoxide reductase catalytic subunit MsrP [Terriglobales bacterium]
MLIRKAPDIASSEITPHSLYLNRRRFLQGAAAGAAMLAMPSIGSRLLADTPQKLQFSKWPGSTSEKQTPFNDITHYNNFYEFSTDKNGPATLAQNFRTRPWTVKVEGLVNKPKTFDIDDILKQNPLEERIYRHRCVEAWSMVIPWVGFPLANFLKQVEPNSKAKFVEFTTLWDPKQMPGENSSVLDWPYVEGLRLDEAMNPLAILAVGLYGQALPNQDGAPIRLVVPWKYGFKSIKSIVKIKLVDKQPVNTWYRSAPGEYGFYSNVNPNRDHPRWSQKTERRLDGAGFLGSGHRIPTQMFNGYGDQVASMYSGMDLIKNY